MTDVSSFSALNLAEPIQRALVERNYTRPSPIQARAIPHLLEGRDLIGCAQTGTGKTAAFALPILHRLAAGPKTRTRGKPRVLVLTPTRELAAQIGDSFANYGKYLDLRHTVVFGGVGQHPQVRALNSGVDILVATPGRLLDLMEQRCLELGHIETFVLDEADRMLDMGFWPDVKRVIGKLPPKRQALLFSATMPAPILEVAGRLLADPVKVEVTPVASTAERIAQHVCHVEKRDKPKLLVHTIGTHGDGRVLVFSRTKHGSNKLVKHLGINGIQSDAIHGNKSQSARERALERFRSGKTRVLVATDIAARGIDVKGITLVINYDIPNEPESYVHRVGRTARAGADGMAVAFCEPEERAWLRDIEKLIRADVPVLAAHPYAITAPERTARAPRPPRNGQGHGNRPANGGGRRRRPRGAQSARSRSGNGRPDRRDQSPSGQQDPNRSQGRNPRRSRRGRRSEPAERSTGNRRPAEQTNSAKRGLWSRLGFSRN